MIKEVSRNSHIFERKCNGSVNTQKVMLLSDLHWDNPKCDRELLRTHLELAKAEGARIHLNGDTFCLMQGKYDPRKSKESIRPEHNVNNYLDAIIEDAANWFAPYAEYIDVVGYGNHETNIIKRQETDPLQRFVDRLNLVAKPDSPVMTGGYGGWYCIRFCWGEKTTGIYKLKYFHGSGGGGIVTRGEINLTRALQMFGGFDCFTMGHIHENKETVFTREAFDAKKCRSTYKDILLLVTGTYKEEYDEGYMGWHVERGAPAKPLGGRMLEINAHRTRVAINVTAKSYRL
jgi:hypothetical protein